MEYVTELKYKLAVIYYSDIQYLSKFTELLSTADLL